MAYGLPDDLEQVNEHAAAQEVVDLVLARTVFAHQALERRGLVTRVVIDVQVRILCAAHTNEVDEVFERLLLLRAIVRPESAIFGRVADAPKVLQPALRLPE